MFHARSTWVHPAPPIAGPLAPHPSRIDTVVIHHPAGQTPDGDPTDRTDIAAYLRAIQVDYVKNRRYSIGYSFAIDHTGAVWECRGWDIQCAANAGHNDHTMALLMIVDQDEPASPAALATARAYVAETARRSGRPVTVTGHGQLTGAATQCPGSAMRRQIAAGEFTPTPTPSPKDPPMADLARRVRMTGYGNVFLIGAGPALHLTPELNADYADVPLRVIAYHDQFAASVLAHTGLTHDDLVPIMEPTR